MIIDNCNSMIQPNDTVIHLGDVIFGKDKQEHLTEIMSKLQGTWILIRGNHDEKDPELYLKCGFHFVCDEIVFGDVLFSHAPTDISNRPELHHNVFGHLHGKIGTNSHRGKDFPFITQDLNKYKHFALEWTDLKPVELEEFLGYKIPKQRDKYR